MTSICFQIIKHLIKSDKDNLIKHKQQKLFEMMIGCTQKNTENHLEPSIIRMTHLQASRPQRRSALPGPQLQGKPGTAAPPGGGGRTAPSSRRGGDRRRWLWPRRNSGSSSRFCMKKRSYF